MEKKFDAPQMILKGNSMYGLDKQEDKKLSYIELEKNSEGKYKRLENKLETSPAEMAKNIKEGNVVIVMPSKSFIKEAKAAEFNSKFEAPAMIAREEKTYGFDKRTDATISYFELKKEGDNWKRTENKLETTPSELSKEIKDKTVKVILPSKEYMAEKQRRLQEENSDKKEVVAKNEPEKKTPDQSEFKPVTVETLNSRQRKEVKEALETGKLDDNKHASSLFKKFDKQLQSIPDKVNGDQLTGVDKLKLLVGDYSDKQNTKFSVQQDKTVLMEGKKSTVLSNLNSEFSSKQNELKNSKSLLDSSHGLSK